MPALIRQVSVKYWPLAALIFVTIVVGVIVVALYRRVVATPAVMMQRAARRLDEYG